MRSWLGWVGAFGLMAACVGCSNAKRDFGHDNGESGGDGGTDDRAGGAGRAGAAGAGGRVTPAGGRASSADAGEAGSSDAAEAGAAGALSEGGAPDTGLPLSIVSVTPATPSATTDDTVSVEFSRPVTANSAGAGISITDSRGAVAGTFALAGNVVTFQPRGSLCFDQKYQVSVSTQVKTSDGVALDASKTFKFSIPDGAWEDPQMLDTSATSNGGSPAAATDEVGNAIVGWSGSSPLVNYYDAQAAAWSGPVAPTFSAPNSNSGKILATALNGRAMLYYAGYGIAERAAGQTWTTTAESALLGTANHLFDASLALNRDGSAILTWDNQSGYDPGSVFAAIRAKGASSWLAPSDALSGAWSITPHAHPMPDNSFLNIYDKRPSAGAFGNLVARRYQTASGWATEHAIRAGATPLTAHDSFGNLIVMASNGTSVATYSFADDAWTPGPDLPPVVNVSARLALAGDGTAFCLYTEQDYDNMIFRVLVRRFVDNQWLPEVELKTSDTSTPSSVDIAADDCGNAEVLWSDGSSLTADGFSVHARRYTPASGWSPDLYVTTAPLLGSMSMNGRGQATLPIGTAGTTAGTYLPQAARFE